MSCADILDVSFERSLSRRIAVPGGEIYETVCYDSKRLSVLNRNSLDREKIQGFDDICFNRLLKKDLLIRFKDYCSD